MDIDALCGLLLAARQLKQVPRTGWAMRGVPNVESVADHSFGVAFLALVLSEMIALPVDRARVVTIALIHDLPEGVTGDLPTPAMTHFPPEAKYAAESAVLETLLNGFSWAEQWRAWWQEFETRSTVEGRLVRDADRLDMLLQAYVYEQTLGNRLLGEFWPAPDDDPFEFPISRQIYEALMNRRAAQRREPVRW